MNWTKIKHIFRELDLHPDQKKFINCVRFHPTESPEHRKAKFELACEDYDNGVPFIQEAWSSDRKRRMDHVRFVDDVDERVLEIETTDKRKDNAKTIRIEREL